MADRHFNLFSVVVIVGVVAIVATTYVGDLSATGLQVAEIPSPSQPAGGGLLPTTNVVDCIVPPQDACTNEKVTGQSCCGGSTVICYNGNTAVGIRGTEIVCVY